MTENAVALYNLTKHYGDFQAVDDLSFHVEQGEIFGFLGPNGAGKTTSLRMLLDIVKPTRGSIEILGSPTALPVRRRIGYLPEERGLYKKMKAVEAIVYFGCLRGMNRKEAKNRANELMDRYGLGEFKKAKIEALSKGMAQKVQLLSTIAHNPELLILDEPFSGLDPINQQALEELILEQRNAGKTIIFSTHVMQHAERLCDRFLIMAKGRSVFQGTLREAQASYNQRITLRSDATIDDIKKFPMVDDVQSRDTGSESGISTLEVTLLDGADPQDFLANLIRARISVQLFERAGAALHDIFVDIASDPAATEERVIMEAAE